MEQNNVLASFANLEGNGRKLVSVVRIQPLPYWGAQPRIDETDFTNKRIWAIIPGWMDDNGVVTSLKTGAPVRVGGYDQIRHEGVGHAYDYEDGAKIIYTRGWKDGVRGEFFAVRECRDCECIHHRAFGEAPTENPLATKALRFK